MKTRRSVLTMIGMSALIGAAATLAGAGPATKTAKIGEAAPDFVLKDASDKSYRLSEHKGSIVVLQWVNPDCPVCRRVWDKEVVADMIEELEAIDKDYVHLAVNSTHYMDAEKTAKYLEKHETEMPGLIDQDGTVGRLYGAKTTPHLMVIDDKGILRYSGAIDDDKSGKKGDEAVNYVVNAVKQIKAGETVTPDEIKPYGCGVKYAKGDARREGKKRSGAGSSRGG